MKAICPPALLYLILSIVALLFLFVQNIGNTDVYCFGNRTCSVSNTPLLFFCKIIVIAVWTWILNLICYAGYTWVSWLLVLVPFFIFLLMIIALMM